MKLKVQRIGTGFCVGECVDSQGVTEDRKALVDDRPSVYESAIELLEAFPRFKEVIINTELTDDNENNH